jgi:hypothetical protein
MEISQNILFLTTVTFLNKILQHEVKLIGGTFKEKEILLQKKVTK